MNSRVISNIIFSIILIAIVALLPNSAACQADYDDLIYLKTGEVIRGIVIEQIPKVSIKIRTNEGDVLELKHREIRRLGKVKPIVKIVKTKILSTRQPVVSLLLSGVLPGAGQFYNGENKKGRVMLGLFGVGMASYYMFKPKGYDNGGVGKEVSRMGIGLAFVAVLYSIIDAPISSVRINKRNNKLSRNDAKIGQDEKSGVRIDEKQTMRLSLVGMGNGEEISPGLRLSLIF